VLPIVTETLTCGPTCAEIIHYGEGHVSFIYNVTLWDDLVQK